MGQRQPALEDAILRHKHRLLELKDKLDQESFFIDESYKTMYDCRFNDLHNHRAVLRDLLPVHDYALVFSMTRITEREFEELYDRIAFYISGDETTMDDTLIKELCRVLVAIFQQGCLSEDYYVGWLRKINSALRVHPNKRMPLINNTIDHIFKVEI